MERKEYTMKKLIVLFLVILLLPSIAFAEVTPEQLDDLSEADRTILLFNVGVAIARKESGEGGQKYSYHLDMDLMKLSIEELYWMYDYLNGTTSLPFDGHIKSLPEQHGIEITPSDEVFATDKRLQFCLFSTVSDACRALEFAVQNNNPEITFTPDTQTLDFARFYITCYAEGAKDDLSVSVEEYTDVLIETICATYPNLNINTLVFCWKIPAVNPDSLYSAMYWCEKEGNAIERGDGTGALYQ